MSEKQLHNEQQWQTQAAGDALRDEGFLGRWSRRKLETRGEPDAQPEFVEPAAVDVTTPEPRVTEPVPEPPSDADMPPLASLNADSDVSGFLSPRVSDGLRKAALQRLFQQPEFNVMDGLDDYCEDYRNFKPLGEVITADMRHRLEVIQQRLERFMADDSEPTTQTEDTRIAAREQATGTDEQTDGNA